MIITSVFQMGLATLLTVLFVVGQPSAATLTLIALGNGIGTWQRHASSKTRVIAVCAESAPSMALSWQAGRPVDAASTTIADGIAVRVPVPDAVTLMPATFDDVMLVSDDEMRDAMRYLLADAGLVVEPAGAAGVAAIAKPRRNPATFGRSLDD